MSGSGTEDSSLGAVGGNLSEPGIGRTSGYDLPVYGLGSGRFYLLHLTALSIILCSLVCAIIVLCWSFRGNRSQFFLWPIGERLAVYMAFCDGLFNVSHSLDHIHYVLQKDHVRPAALCVFYGIILQEFITAQVLLVNMASINAFVMVYRRRSLNFASYDHRLLIYVFGVPLVLAVVLAATGQLGPSGAFCHFDMVAADPAVVLVLTTVLFFFVFIVNSLLYVLTWKRINREAKSIQASIGRSQLVSASHRAAKNCMLFVVAFVAQWCTLSFLSVWQSFGPPPFWLIMLTTSFTNLGGVLNLLVFVRIRRRPDSGVSTSVYKNTGTCQPTAA